MPDALRLLDQLEQGIVQHGGDLGGWTRRTDDTLQLFDGRITLRARLEDLDHEKQGAVHVHVLSTLHDYDDEVLDACIIGIGSDHDAALAQAAVIWITCVAGPIKSFLDGKPVCMTRQAGAANGDPEAGYSRGDYGLPGLRAYVGPSICRGGDEPELQSALDDTKPWFRFAAESAAPRCVHLAKATIQARGPEGWYRELEIDGHEVAHSDPHWPAGVDAPDFCYFTRFALFEFPRDSSEIARRAELERTIRYFAENFTRHPSVDDLLADMGHQGFDPDLAHEAESIATIAFGRALFEPMGVRYASTIIRARCDGRVETDVPLMSLPAYSRARALAVVLRETMPEREFHSLCLYNAESNAIAQALEGGVEISQLDRLKMYPCIVPDRNVDNRTMDAAFAALQALLDQNRARPKKPWCKFW